MSDNWLTAGECFQRFGFTAVLLHLWRTRPCPALGGEKLRFEHQDRGPALLYHQADLERIAATPPRRGRFQDDAGIVWVSAEEAHALLNRARFQCSLQDLYHWRDDGVSFWRGGKKLRTQQVLTRTPGDRGFRLVWYFAEDDIRGIPEAKAANQSGSTDQLLSAEEAQAQFGLGKWQLTDLCRAKKLRSETRAQTDDSGRTRWTNVYSREDLQRVYADRARKPVPAGDRDWITFAVAARSLGCTHRMLHLWSKEGCPYLPDGRTLAVSKRPINFGHQVKTAWTCFAKDLAAIREARAAPPDAPHVTNDGIYLPARVVKLKYRLSANTLVYWRKQGWIRALRIDRAGPNIRGGRLWVYHEADVVARKSGQPLLKPPPADPTPPSSPGPTEAPKVPPPDASNRGGRPKQEQTQELYKFCWEARQRGEKRALTMVRANAHFGREVIREDRWVTVYAGRYKPQAEEA
jgi:hypothetical protein